MICGHFPGRPHSGKPAECSRLCCHEIANGTHRQKAIDKPYAILVLCWSCNSEVVTDKSLWPETRQLALLKRKAPEDYDLEAYNAIVGWGPDRITENDVDLAGLGHERNVPEQSGSVRCMEGGSES